MLKFFVFFPTLTLIPLLSGCNSPFQEDLYTHQDNSLSIEDLAVDEAVSSVLAEGFIQLPSSNQTTVEAELQGRRDVLDAISPSPPNTPFNVTVGNDLHVGKEAILPIAKNKAINVALTNNLDVEIASYQPAISSEAIRQAEASFDFLFGFGGTLGRNRIPQQTVPNNPFSSNEQSADTLNINGSLAKRLYSGGTLTLSTDVSKSENNNTDFVFQPNPAWQTVGTLGLNQPLLRNFGDSISRAQVKISTITHGQSLEDFKLSLMKTLTATEVAYLDLILQWKTLQVREWLYEQSQGVVSILELRRGYDTGESDYAQAVATLQQRSVEVISQRSLVHSASDALKALMNSDTYGLESNSVLQPVSALEPLEVKISLREAVMTAIEHRPDLRRLALEIDKNDISLEVADNARLPQLDLQAQMSFYGLGDSAGDGYNEVFNRDYLNYVAGLVFEVPLGNHAAEASYESTRLEKMTSTARYRKGVQDAVVEVKRLLRDVVTNAELMQANRAYRVAQAENMRALQVEEETMSGLTPTFLNLKLQTQSGLASARVAEITSIVNYNKAIANLYLAMGVTTRIHGIDVHTHSPLTP